MGKYDNLRNDLQDIDWQSELEKFSTMDDQWNFLRDKIMASVDRNIPKFKSSIHKNKSIAFNEKILRTIRKKTQIVAKIYGNKRR